MNRNPKRSFSAATLMRLTSQAWRDPVISTVLATLIAGSLVAWWRWSWVRHVASGTRTWLASTSVVGNWLILLGIAALAILALTTGLAWRTRLMTERQQRLVLGDYNHDTFQHLGWHWAYTALGEIVDLTPICPKCSAQLKVVRTPLQLKYSKAMENVSFDCDMCRDFTPYSFTVEEFLVERRTLTHIERNLRTGEWRRIVEMQRRTQKHKAGRGGTLAWKRGPGN